MEYAGFWRRLGSHLIDMVIWMIPLYFMEQLFEGQAFRIEQTVWSVLSLFISIWYQVILVVKLGGTPGRLLLKTKIRKLDGSPVTYREAGLRYSVNFFLNLIISIGTVITIHKVSDGDLTKSMFERAKISAELQPTWMRYFGYLSMLWVWSEFVVMMFNQKRRAIHDFIAGTVVIKDPPLTQADADQEFVG